MKNTSIIERIEYAAQNGYYEIPLFVWNKTAKKLRKEGFVLTPTKVKSVRKGENHYLISWKDNYTLPLSNMISSIIQNTGSISTDALLKSLTKHNIEITVANRMWIIATTNQKK